MRDEIKQPFAEAAVLPVQRRGSRSQYGEAATRPTAGGHWSGRRALCGNRAVAPGRAGANKASFSAIKAGMPPRYAAEPHDAPGNAGYRKIQTTENAGILLFQSMCTPPAIVGLVGLVGQE